MNEKKVNYPLSYGVLNINPLTDFELSIQKVKNLGFVPLKEVVIRDEAVH